MCNIHHLVCYTHVIYSLQQISAFTGFPANNKKTVTKNKNIDQLYQHELVIWFCKETLPGKDEVIKPILKKIHCLLQEISHRYLMETRVFTLANACLSYQVS